MTWASGLCDRLAIRKNLVQARRGTGYAMRMVTELVPGVTADPKVTFGKAVIAGTRTPVAVVLAQLAAGVSEEILRREYDLTGEQVRAAIRYGASLAEQETVRATAE